MDFLIETISKVEWQHALMWFIGGLLIFLAIKNSNDDDVRL